MATIGANVFTVHTPITLGILRNGDATVVARTARESSIGPKYFFSGVRYAEALAGNAEAFTTACPVVALFEAQWRSAFSTIVEASVEDARTAHDAAAAAGAVVDAFDEPGTRTAAALAPANRLEAIALGAAHTALVASYQISDVDLRAPEIAAARLALVPAPAAADQAEYLALVRQPNAGWEIALADGAVLDEASAAQTVMLDAAPLNAVEAELAYCIMSIGQAAPVRAGAQLYEDGHHYHSDSAGSARHGATEKEVLGRASEAARNMWRANLAMLRNAVWHSGIHFVSTDVLQQFAEDPHISERLDATGYGSMSVGLPAQEDLFRRANSYTAVYRQVVQTARAHGHTLSIEKMEATVTALAALPRRGALPAQRPALPGAPAAAWPPGCDTRAKALKLFLEPALDTAEPVAAWMFGYFREICSRNGVRSNSQEGSLLRSYSLKRALANYLGEANRAQEMYSARARYIRAQGEEGKLETYSGSA